MFLSSESVQESASLLGVYKSKKCDKSWISRLVVLLFCVLMLVALWSIVPIMSTAIQLEMKEWERMHERILLDIEKSREEKRVITDEIQLLQVEFREKKRAVTDELQQLQADRDDTRRKWENEREANEQRRRGHVPFWGEARLITTVCPKDRFRRYDARMYNLLVEDDWYARCMNERIDIAGRTFASPHSCINHVCPTPSSKRFFL